MVLFQALCALAELTLGLMAQARLGVIGLLVLSAVIVGVRARHSRLAVGAVVVFVFLMSQA
ncbi:MULTISPECIES: hypothetical protein [unclassified Streptomyces]|uniref:hypothetical protein n=1 Tax=unclassified Streptomyces TaxID=2593676 RepID=UPI0016512AA8|nr:hypothetical protein [Streptomyces sp. uw30]WSU51010.1 hypothetical protein OG254_22850 [Streptomyces sp. NBC_01092]